MSSRPIPTPFDAPLPGEAGAQPVQPQAQVATPFDAPLPGEVPSSSGVVAQQMAQEGVTDYKPGQGLPYPRLGGIRSSDITPSQAAGGAQTIAGVAGATALPAVIGAGARAALPYVVQAGNWAEANPMLAKILLEGAKMTGLGTAIYKGLKKATK